MPSTCKFNSTLGGGGTSGGGAHACLAFRQHCTLCGVNGKCLACQFPYQPSRSGECVYCERGWALNAAGQCVQVRCLAFGTLGISSGLQWLLLLAW